MGYGGDNAIGGFVVEAIGYGEHKILSTRQFKHIITDHGPRMEIIQRRLATARAQSADASRLAPATKKPRLALK